MLLILFLKGKTVNKFLPFLDEKPGAPLGAVNHDIQQGTTGASYRCSYSCFLKEKLFINTFPFLMRNQVHP
jgi:hypothetical protein